MKCWIYCKFYCTVSNSGLSIAKAIVAVVTTLMVDMHGADLMNGEMSLCTVSVW